MSYDIYLRDQVTKETIQLPTKHVMVGGTFAATYDKVTNTWTPVPISDAHLNITWNYGKYYFEVTEGDPRFAHDEISAYYADGTTGPIKTEYGIRGIYGKTGAESLPMLKDMITMIEDKYKDKDGNWITTERKKSRYLDPVTKKELDIYKDILSHSPPCEYNTEEYTVSVNEGPNDDYWESTAANAIKPLYQLIAFAQLRPDGIWEGD